MIAGLLRAELHLPGARSLKEKRKPLKSLLAGLQNRFHCAAAEVDHQDLHQRAAVGLAVVGADRAHVEAQLRAIETFVRRDREFQVLDIQIDFAGGPESFGAFRLDDATPPEKETTE